MARSRVYTVGFAGVSVAAVQDLFSLAATAGKAFELHYIKLGQVTQTTIGGLKLRLRRMPATVTVGSGGTVATPGPIITTDVAATVTARTNDTVQATSTGTVVDMPDTWDLPFGYLWMPPEADRPIIGNSGAFVLSLDSAPSSAIVCNGHMAFAELY